MKSLYDFIFESKSIITYSNKHRKKELANWLKNKNYKDYVKTLNDMLKDPKCKSLLEDGFGGLLGDTKLSFSVKEITVSKLIPSQSEIDLDKSVKFILKQKKSFYNSFKNPIIILNKPIITFKEKYIIDGHHSWMQPLVLNPNGKILAFNYDGDITPTQMLKVVQGTIAAVKASNNENNEDKLPSNNISGPNLYSNDLTEKDIKSYIEKNIDEDLISLYIDYIKDCMDYNSTINWITNRLLDIKNNHYPSINAPKRKDMPQVFKAGTIKNDKNSAMPDNSGSALNKLKDNKFLKSSIK